jgi:hypothetical protein
MNTSMIMDLAEKHGLKVRNRKREIVYKRYYLWSELRRWHSLDAIGKMFGMDHCSVLHGLKQHNIWMRAKDYEYLKTINELHKEVHEDYLLQIEEDKVWMCVDHVSGNMLTLTLKLNTDDSSHFLDKSGYITREDLKQLL